MSSLKLKKKCGYYNYECLQRSSKKVEFYHLASVAVASTYEKKHHGRYEVETKAAETEKRERSAAEKACALERKLHQVQDAKCSECSKEEVKR
jgi:hypothetical protein